jgi:hypothetical protein
MNEPTIHVQTTRNRGWHGADHMVLYHPTIPIPSPAGPQSNLLFTESIEEMIV